MFLDYAIQCETVAVMIIERQRPQPKPMVRIFSGCAVEVLIDHIRAEALIEKEATDIGNDIGAAADLVSLAAMDAHESRPFEVIGGGLGEHLENVFRREVNHFHPGGMRGAVSRVERGDVGRQPNIDRLEEISPGRHRKTCEDINRSETQNEGYAHTSTLYGCLTEAPWGISLILCPSFARAADKNCPEAELKRQRTVAIKRGGELSSARSFAQGCSRASGDNLLQIGPGMFARDNDAQTALRGNAWITGDGWQNAGIKKGALEPL
jgi:hypothetical protein